MHPIIAKLQKKDLKNVPEVKTGYTVRVSQKIKEGAKERTQNFEGLVIKVSHGTATEKTFTVRKIVEGIGVEKIFPFHSPNITKIHVVKKAKVRREKLYYMRERFGKSARLSERHVTDEERATEQVKMDALYAEAVKEDEKRQAADVENTSKEAVATEQDKIEKVETAETPAPEAKAEEVKTEEVEKKEESATDESNSEA